MHKLLKKPKKILKKSLKKFAPQLRELHMLHHLHKNPSHGYELIRYFQEDVPADLETKANRIYPSLEKMKKKGYLKLSIDETTSTKKPRKIYSLTEEGRKHLIKEIDELRSSLDTLKEYVESIEKEVKE